MAGQDDTTVIRAAAIALSDQPRITRRRSGLNSVSAGSGSGGIASASAVPLPDLSLRSSNKRKRGGDKAVVEQEPQAGGSISSSSSAASSSSRRTRSNRVTEAATTTTSSVGGKNARATSGSRSTGRQANQNLSQSSLSSISTGTTFDFPSTPADNERSTPSERALGKRRAISPPPSLAFEASLLSDDQHVLPNVDEQVIERTPKRRRTSRTSAVSATATTPATNSGGSVSYNLRPRAASSGTRKATTPHNTLSNTNQNKANKTGGSTANSQTRSTMPRKGKASGSPSNSGLGGSVSRNGNTSLRAKAAANAAIAAANASSNSGRAAHANSQASSSSSSTGGTSSRRQRDPDLDEEALLGIMDASRELDMQDEDMDEDDDEEVDSFDGDDVDGDGHDDSMQLIGGATMDLHDDEEGEHDDLSQLPHMHSSDPFDEEDGHHHAGHQVDDDDEDDNDVHDHDEDDEIEGTGRGEMLDDDFDPPMTFDADGNPLSSGGAANAMLEAVAAAEAFGLRPPSSDARQSSVSSSNDDIAPGRGAAAAAAIAAAREVMSAAGEGRGGGLGSDDDFGSFAASLRGFSSSFLGGGMGSRLRGMLNNLRSRDLSVRMIALQELSELLSMSTEDTLAGSFSVDAFVKELVIILRGSAHVAAMNLEGLDEDDEYAMAQAIAAAADAADAGGDEGSEDEMQLLACRCLANLIEAMPAASHNIVSNGAVPVLCEKLLNITVIDLAEQSISTLEKLSEEMPASIVREGGLAALLTFLDFFSIHVQRTAITAVARCCNRLSVEQFDKVKEVMPILKNVLSYADTKLVEQACLAITGIVESFRHYPDKLETLLTGDLLSAVAALLVPGQASSVAVVDASTHPKILKLLSTAARSSAEIAISLVEADIVTTLYSLLTGISPPSEEEGLQGIKKHLEADDMLVLNNLVHRSKDVVQETLSLVHELMPALPKDGIFDPKAHMHRSSKSKVKKEEGSAGPSTSLLSSSAPAASSILSRPRRGSQRSGRVSPTQRESSEVAVKIEESTPTLDDEMPFASSSVPQSTSSWGAARATAMSSTSTNPASGLARSRDGSQARRTELFNPPATPEFEGRRKQVNRFFSTLLPILLDVYSASIGVQVRYRTFQSMLQIVYYADKDHLPTILTIVPMASFLASCFSSRDQPSLVIDALQMTELLLTKVPDTYQYFFRREGVLYELEKMALEPLVALKSKSRKDKVATTTSSGASTPGFATPQLGTRTPVDDGGDSVDLGTRIAMAAGAPATTSALQRPTSQADGLQKDSITLRARHLKKMLKASSSNDGSLKADSELNKVRALVQKLLEVSPTDGSTAVDTDSAEQSARSALANLAKLFNTSNVMSSFEMQESGLIGGLLQFATSGNDASLSNDKRRRMIMDAFLIGNDNTNSPLSHLVKRLQEALGKAEEFDVLTALPSGGDSRQNPALMLARQLKIRLHAADDTSIPRSVANVIVSIHAIATFRALNDYLRPRIASAIAAEERGRGSPLASTSNQSGRLSGVLAAFAAATGMPSSEFAAENPNLANALAASAPSSLAGPSHGGNSSETNGQSEHVRRSSRLSARASTSNIQAASAKSSRTPSPSGSREDHLEYVATPCPFLAKLISRLHSCSTEARAMTCDESGHEDDDHVLEDGLEVPQTTEERPVNFEVAADGSRVSARTPDGTRIQTPVPGGSLLDPSSLRPAGSSSRLAVPTGSGASTPSEGPSASSRPRPPASRSYAAALRAAPADWHLQFSMGGRPVDLDTTIFGACYQHEVRNASASGARGIWHNVYTVTFKKVPGPPVIKSEESATEAPSFETELPGFLASDVRQANILRLLSVLHYINADSAEVHGRQRDLNHLDASVVPGNVFVNNKLTAKLNRQLEEPMIVASDCLPDWSVQLPQLFPFLFPFETRYTFLQSTSFGYARLMQKWLQNTRPDSNSRRDENLSFLGRITRQKVRISRQRLFESAFKVFELYGSSKAMLEVEYFDEVGTGLGPTLEFYSLVSKEYRKSELNIWRNGDTPMGAEYTANSRGLFPSPVSVDLLSVEEQDRRDTLFKTLGTVVAKAQMDSRIIDFPFNKMFMKLVLGQPVPLTTASVRVIDPTLAQSLDHLQKYLDAVTDIEASQTLSQEEKDEALRDLMVDKAKIEDLALDFTVPGYDIEMKESGRDTAVTLSNLREYLDLVIDWTIVKGTQAAVSKFKEGFSLVFPVSDLHTFTPDELVQLFGDADEDWSFITISEHIKADHGYSLGSTSITNFISILSELDHTLRRKALSFMTGASRLPIGGFAGLNPPLTVVRKLPDNGESPDDLLPSVMTCVSYLKSPEYSSKEVMRKQFLRAIEEANGFHLS